VEKITLKTIFPLNFHTILLFQVKENFQIFWSIKFIKIAIFLGAAESQFSEATLREQLTLSSEMLERAERHELQVPLQRLLLPLLEARRDYTAMASAFRHVAQSCSRAAECATRSGKRLLGTYYRVAFYGQV
jgi:hypothetical protein